MKMMHTYKSGARRAVVYTSLAALVLSLGMGCEKADWEDPAYISKQLIEGDSTTKRLALEKVRGLSDEQRVQVVPALSKVYLDGAVGQKEAMTYLVQIRHPDAEAAYLAEVKTNDTSFAAAAAEALGMAKVTNSIGALITILESTDSVDTKQGIMRALSHMPDPQVVAPLVKILALDVDNNPIALHAYACEILGNLGQDNPQALDEAARRALVRSVFLANTKSQNVGRECSLAVQQVGDSMIPVLLETFKGENEAVQTLLLTYNKSPDFAFPENHSRLVATVRLTSLRASEAVAPFIEDLAGKKEAPATVRGDHSVMWRMKEANFTDEMIQGLGDIGDPAAREILEKVLVAERNKDWDDITDGLVELQFRQNAAHALNRIGDKAALPALMKMAQSGVINDLERRAVMLQQRNQPISMVERYQFNWMAAQAYAYLAGPDKEGEFKKLIAATKEAELKAKYESFLPAFEVAAECGAKGDDAAKAACYGEKLKSDNVVVREKSVHELSRLGEAAGPLLVANLDTDDLGTRELLSLALYRVPTAAAVSKIDEILEAEARKGGGEYRLDHSRLRLVRAYLKNKLGPEATSAL